MSHEYCKPVYHANGDARGAAAAVHASRAVEPIPDPYKLSSVVGALDANLSSAYALVQRMQKAMDFICGPQPQPAPPVSDVPEYVSALDVVNEKQRLLWLALDQLDTEVRRLERVVG